MNTISLTLCASTRTGCLSAAIPACAEVSLTLAGDTSLPAGTSLALLTPRGTTLAHTILAEEAAPGATLPLSTLTAQAAEYTHSCRAGDTREAILAIGDSEHPLALVPARIAQNPLYTLAPPTDLAPAYPTTETLNSLLAEMQAASNAAAQSATAAETAKADAQSAAAQAASRAEFALAAKTDAQSAATVAQTAQGKAEAAKTTAEAAKTDAASSANAAAASELKAFAYKNAAEASVETAGSYRQQAIDSAKKAEQLANTAATHALKASSSASKAANSATDAAQKAADGVTAILQGKVDAAEAAKTAAEAAKAGAEAAQAAAETAKTGAEAAKAAAASSSTAAANSASAAAKSATDLADAVATAKSLDGRVSTIEGLGTQYKRDLRVDATGLVNPLATSLATSSPFASIYRRTNKGYDGRYFSDCQHHIFNDYDSALIYDANGKYLGRITNTGVGFSTAHESYKFACLTTQIGDYRYGIFNGIPYNRNKMIISKFKRNADNTDYELVASRVYATRGVDGAIFQWGNSYLQNFYVGPVVPSRRSGHILVFGNYYMSVKNDEGAIVDKSIGYGYIVFDSDLNFVKWDDDTGAFVSSDTFDMSYFHAVSGRASEGTTAYWAWQEPKYLSLVAVQQATNATNGLYYVDPHDNLVPITFSSGTYANAGIDYLPLGGSLLSVDSDALFNTYAPRLVMSGIEQDSERGKVRVVKIINGARTVYINMTLTDEEPGCTFTVRNDYPLTKTQFNGSRIYNDNYLFLHGRWNSAYSETALLIYYGGYIYSSNGKYVISLSLPLALAHISPQRGMYARSGHVQLAPCGGYTNPTGAVLLNM